MSAFDDMAEAIFADENLALDALWYAGGIGAGLAVRVLKIAPDVTMQFGLTRAVAPSLRLKLLASVMTPNCGDQVRIATDKYEVMGTPKRDVRGLVWDCELQPIG